MASEMFERVFNSGDGSIVFECVCGRIHYNYADAPFFEPGELEGLEENSEKNPDRYIGCDHTVGAMMVPFVGRVVYDCPCKLAEKAEHLLRVNAVNIAKYLKEWAEEMRGKAEMVDVDDATIKMIENRFLTQTRDIETVGKLSDRGKGDDA